MTDGIDDELQVTITDNGRGLDAVLKVAPPSGGHGMGSMYSRAATVGGRLSFVDAAPGLSVVFQVAMSADARQAA